MSRRKTYEVRLRDFTEYPGPGLSRFGKFSGEEFLKTVLWPAFLHARQNNMVLYIDMDGTAGFGTSFARESILRLIEKADSESIQDELIVKSDDIKILDALIQRWIREGGETDQLAA